MKLIVVNQNDMGSIRQALSINADILLIQDGVYFLNNSVANKPDFGVRKVYALGDDVEKRGLSDRVGTEVELITYDGMVDLLFSGATVVNL
jgi:sulfur relay protein TusB/DsrH